PTLLFPAAVTGRRHTPRLEAAGEAGGPEANHNPAAREQLALHLGNARAASRAPEQERPTNAVQAMRPASILAKMTARSQCRTSEAARRSSPPASCGSAPKRDPTSDRPQLLNTLKEILFRVGRRSGYLPFGVFTGDFSDLLLLWPGSRFGADSHVVSCIKLTGPDKLTVPCHRRQVPISEQRRNQMLPRAV